MRLKVAQIRQELLDLGARRTTERERESEGEGSKRFLRRVFDVQVGDLKEIACDRRRDANVVVKATRACINGI